MNRDHVARFRARAGPISWEAAELARCTIEPELARMLHVAALLEEDTAITVAHAHAFGLGRSADLAAFLPTWDREEAEHGRALRALLAHQEYVAPEPARRSIALRRRALARVPIRPLVRRPETSFLFCVLGAAAEYVATVIYAQLAAQTRSPRVERLVRSIARQEARHFAFFLDAARIRGDRLTDLQGRAARRVLRSLWEPIGLPTLGRSTWHATFAPWLDDEHFRGRVARMDRIVDSIPHLAEARLMATFLDDLPALSRPGRGGTAGTRRSSAPRTRSLGIPSG